MLPVTLVKCSSISVTGQETTLYKLIAGRIDQDLKPTALKQSVTIETVFNNFMHGQIKSKCEIELLSYLSTTKQKKLEGEMPCFVVAESMPLSSQHLTNFATIKPFVDEAEGRLSFKYVHGQNPDLFIQVFEPASPSLVKIQLSKGTVLSSALLYPGSQAQVCCTCTSNIAIVHKIDIHQSVT